MTSPEGLTEGQPMVASELRKCSGCHRATRGCRRCKEVRQPPYDHLCAVCHLTALGRPADVGHDWESA
jgi:hypothetical protein